MRARLIDTREIAPDVRHFVFEAPEVEKLSYEPGQFVSFTASIQGKNVTRAYSIASAPDGIHFELCLNRVQDGVMSPWLFELDKGAEVAMAGPLGYFVPKRPFRESILVATGTGIAPFRAFLQAPQVREAGQKVTLLFGTRYERGVLYRNEFEQLAEEWPLFRYLPTLTRPEEDWQGRTGRVQKHLHGLLDEASTPDVYTCGLKEMVNDVRAILKTRGFHRSRIIYEKYD